MIYRTHIDLNEARLNDLDTLVEYARQWGYPTLDIDARTLVIDFDVDGDPEGIEDLWDLRGICSELEADLEGYITLNHIPKPELITNFETKWQ